MIRIGTPAARPERSEIVVGYDASAGAVDAAAAATGLAALWDADVRVVTVHPFTVLGERGRAARELDAARTAAEGGRLIEGSVPCRTEEVTSTSVAAGLRAAAGPGTACVVVGRPRSPLHVRGGSMHAVLQGSPTAVAVPRAGLVPRPSVHGLILAVDVPEHGDPDGDPAVRDDLGTVVDFAAGLRSVPGAIDVCAVTGADRGAPQAWERAARAIGLKTGREVPATVRTPAELRDGGTDHLVVRCGRAFGAHGHLQPSRADLHLLHAHGPSVLLLPPAAVCTTGSE